jgi:predicted transcriptional regulator
VKRQPATREEELKAAIEAAGLPARDYRVYYALLKRAEWKTAVIRDQFQPRSLADLARLAHMSEANVKRSLNHLQRHGWLLRHRHFSDRGIGGRGHATSYQLENGKDCDCPKGAQAEPVSADKGAHDEPRKGLSNGCNAAGQGPVSAKSVSDVVGSRGEAVQRPACYYCHERPVGPGGVLCPECKTAIEERNRRLWEPA